LLLLNSFVSVSQAYIIIDHNSVAQFGQMPDYWINEVKKMHLNIPGESHSRAYGGGLQLLRDLDTKYAVSFVSSGALEPYREDALRVSVTRYDGGGWRGYTGEDIWFTNANNRQIIKDHIDYANNNNRDIAAIGFGWCYDMTFITNPLSPGVDPVYNTHWAGASSGGPEGTRAWGLDDEDYALTGNSVNMDTYLNATQEYIDHVNNNNYDTTVLFTTGPVDSDMRTGENTGETGYQRYLKHEHIRNYAQANDGVLFDYADILTHNDAGEPNIISWVDHDGVIKYFPYIHPDNEVDSQYHIGSNGALRLGKALWVLMARLAGWDGCAAVRGDVTGDCAVDSSDLVVLADAWLTELNSPAWNVLCDIAPQGGNGVIDSQDFAVLAEQWQEGVQTIRAAVSLDSQWMYQNLPGQTASTLTASDEIAYDPLNNSGYAHSWEFVLPADVNVPPSTVAGGGSSDTFWTFAAPDCDEVGGLSDSGLPFKVKVTITGLQYGNTGTAEADFGIALLGDVNNDGVVNVADRGIINAFWRTGAAGSFTLRDCDLNCDGAVNVADRSVANAIWRGLLGQNFVSNPCPLR